MPCFTPLEAFRANWISNQTGKRPMVFSLKHAYNGADPRLHGPVPLPCGQCCGCRLDRSGQWAVRCSHEASLYQNNCFITLTYADEFLPEHNSLDKLAFPLFMKRFRKKFHGLNYVSNGEFLDPAIDDILSPYPHTKIHQPIRYYHCGEYGETYGRPHYHACIFNFDFPDKIYHRQSATDYPIFRSPALEELWPFGYSEIGSVTFDSAAYVARYIMKKVNGDAAYEHYTRISPDTGHPVQITPEYTTMSRRPGIAKAWYDKYHDDVFPHDYVVIGTKKMRVPKFYDSQYEITNPNEFSTLKATRIKNSLKHVDNNTPERLNVRMKVTQSRLSQLIRPIQ